ncbi:MAG TPA: hypothetical protein VME44_18110 [Streptosporangiaceae bacterium]|nr:hypothetical protein [Streptosporangiaceae bacterium]
MSRLARWIAPAALAGGLVAGLVAIPAAQASSAASIISIKAISPSFPGLKAKDHGLVDGHALVIYKIATVNTAIVSGTVTTSATNDTAQLMAESFGKKTYSDVGSPQPLITVNSTTASFSFSVTPSLATHYEVQLAGTDTELSSAVTVYVTLATDATSSKVSCTRARCVQTVKISTTLPASAYKTESRKHVYLYLAIGHLRGTKPILPKDYTLSKASTASKATRKTATRFVETLRFIVPHPNSKTVWVPNACTKDAESKDGLGLPGHHGCGNKHIARSAIYIG